MADLFERIFVRSEDYEKISVHTFHAVLIDFIEGGSTQNQIVIGLALDTDAEADLDAILAKIDGVSELVQKHRFAVDFHAVGLITETGLKYTTKTDFRIRLGL